MKQKLFENVGGNQFKLKEIDSEDDLFADPNEKPKGPATDYSNDPDIVKIKNDPRWPRLEAMAKELAANFGESISKSEIDNGDEFVQMYVQQAKKTNAAGPEKGHELMGKLIWQYLP